ncbi:MAG TPA: type II toxin-antitoxin system RelE/ParE family toxin [Stellaceae bacterium]
MTEEERFRLIDFLARSPEAGDLIPGTGGLRKLRWGGKSKGKSGGYRAIYYFFDRDVPIFLLAIYAKAMKEDLTSAEKKQLRDLAIILKARAKTKRTAREQ